jgi:hypothetical protein
VAHRDTPSPEKQFPIIAELAARVRVAMVLPLAVYSRVAEQFPSFRGGA